MRTTQGTLKKRGRVYWARWYVDGKEYKRSTGKTNQTEARAVLDQWIAPHRLKNEAERLRFMVSRAESMEAAALTASAAPLVHVWGWYTGTTSITLPRPATLRQYETQWDRFMLWMREHHPDRKAVEAVDHDTARAFIASVRAARTANTANKYLRFLSTVWTVLRKDGRTDAANPWANIAAVKEVQQGRRELTLEELRHVCQSAQGDLRPLVAIGLYTGLRLGDVSTLKWSEVDLERGIICRIPSKSQEPKPVLIPIHPTLAAMLAELDRDGKYVLPRIAADYKRHVSYVTDRVQALFTACGVQTTRPGEKGRAVVEVGFHSLRHSFVSLSRAAGAPLAVVEAIVGHSNPAMTRHYSHIGEAAAAAAVGLLPSITGPDAPTTAPDPARAASEQLDRARRLVEAMTAKNWKTTKAELLEVLR